MGRLFQRTSSKAQPTHQFRVGQRVRIRGKDSSFVGRRGMIVDLLGDGTSDAFVHLDGERLPMRFGDFDVVVGEASEPNLTGAE